eukprot:scaffold1729_cov88-Alexandrium_tamarense.AAC.1
MDRSLDSDASFEMEMGGDVGAVRSSGGGGEASLDIRSNTSSCSVKKSPSDVAVLSNDGAFMV